VTGNNPEANCAKIGARKRKEMKAKVLSFVFMSFSESGLFNGLQPIQIKNSPSYFSRLISRAGLQD
jgi:hypothetical protein